MAPAIEGNPKREKVSFKSIVQKIKNFKPTKQNILNILKQPRTIVIILISLVVLFALGTLLIEESAVRALNESTVAQLNAQVENQYMDLFNKSKIASIDTAAKGRIPKYTYNDILRMDLTKPSMITTADLKKISQGGLKGQEKYFIEAEEKYGVNCVFLFSIAVLESGWGTQMYASNNMFGFGGIDFSSKKECILTVGKSLGQDYLNPKGSLYNGKTISGVHRRYAASSKWTAKIATIMETLYSEMRQNNLNTIKKNQ